MMVCGEISLGSPVRGEWLVATEKAFLLATLEPLA
jgi:hypothetical protein